MIQMMLHVLFGLGGVAIVSHYGLAWLRARRDPARAGNDRALEVSQNKSKLMQIIDRFGMLSGAAMLAVSAMLFMTLSSTWVPENKIGLLERIYFGDAMPEGQVVAMEGQKGPQATILMPGYHLRPYIHFVYDVTEVPMLEVPEGQVAFLVALDGARGLNEGQYLADPWPLDEQTMIKASVFLSDGPEGGRGQRGPQLNVLKPGLYPLNTYLWRYEFQDVLEVRAGEVAVIRSNILERPARECPQSTAGFDGKTNEGAARPIVPKGCIGVWDSVLTTGRYYINRKAKVPTIVPIRMQKWDYKGGYTRREFDLQISDNGSITQQEVKATIPVPEGAADEAITVRVEGWSVPVEFRINGQVNPSDAPMIVATVGGIEQVEDKVVTPVVRDVLRTIGGDQDTAVLDFMNNRDEIVSKVEEVVAQEAAKFGFTVLEARMGEPAIPPELLVARRREQLATQLALTFEQERRSQEQREKAEEARARADQQGELVAAAIKAESEKHNRERKRLAGEGDKLAALERAKGQRAIAEVLGPERTMMLQMVDRVLQAAENNPDLLKQPHVYVDNGGGLGSGGEGSMAVLGALLGPSNAGQMVRQNMPQEK